MTETSELGTEVVVPIRSPASIVAVGCEVAKAAERKSDRRSCGNDFVCFMMIVRLQAVRGTMVGDG